MSLPPVQPVPPTASPPARRQSCLFYGCLTLAVVFVMVGVLGFLGYQYVRKAARNLIENYTDAAPASFTRVELSKEEAQDLERRLVEFQQALEHQTNEVELVLSDAELNALLARNPQLAGKVKMRIEGERLQGQLSWPLEDMGPFKLEGRYLNGLATFAVALTNARLRVTIEDLQINGKTLPPSFLKELRKQNLARDVLKDPNVVENIERFDSIEVRDSRIVLRNKVK